MRGDTTYMEYANTLAVRSLWYHFRLLCRASDRYKEEVTDYLQIANKLRCRLRISSARVETDKVSPIPHRSQGICYGATSL